MPDDLYMMAAQHLLERRRSGMRVNLVALFHDSVDACTPEWNRKKLEEQASRALEGPQENAISYEEHCRRHGKDPAKKPWEQLA